MILFIWVYYNYVTSIDRTTWFFRNIRINNLGNYSLDNYHLIPNIYAVILEFHDCFFSLLLENDYMYVYALTVLC